MGIQLKVFHSLEELNQSNDFVQLETPVAVTAPFIFHDRVIIGLYGLTVQHACVDVSLDEFELIKKFLYEPQRCRLAVHGISRIWRDLRLGDEHTRTDLILDTELMAYLLNSAGHRKDYSVSHLVHEYLSEDYPLWHKVLADNPYPESIRGMLAYDAHLIYDLAYGLLELIDHADPDLKFNYFYIQLPLGLMLLQMSRYGIGVDGAAAAVAYQDALNKSKALADEIAGGTEMNLWSERDVYELLREQKIWPASSKEAVTHGDLKRLAPKHHLAAQILEWRDRSIDLRFLHDAAGATRVHPEWKVMSRTGRIYASDPPVQNVSKEICRPLLIPAPGCVFLKADYKQIQMRLLANFSGDPELVKAFREGKDVHWLTAEMCGIQGAADKEKRDRAKEVNFGILFQMTAWGLAQKLNTDTRKAQGYIKAFWSKYSVAKAYLDGIVADLKKKEPRDRYVESYSGRRRLFDQEFGVPEQRGVKATVLQQGEADVLTLAFVSLQAIFRRRNMKSRIVMIIHDCIWVEAPLREAEQARRLMEDTMKNAVEFPLVPLEVEFED